METKIIIILIMITCCSCCLSAGGVFAKGKETTEPTPTETTTEPTITTSKPTTTDATKDFKTGDIILISNGTHCIYEWRGKVIAYALKNCLERKNSFGWRVENLGDGVMLSQDKFYLYFNDQKGVELKTESGNVFVILKQINGKYTLKLKDSDLYVNGNQTNMSLKSTPTEYELIF